MMTSSIREKTRPLKQCSGKVNPVLVEIYRGDIVESRHRGALAVCDVNGDCVYAIGDVAAPIYPRSAIKALQCLPLIETGAACAFGFTAAQIALACASHLGEPAHINTARTMLDKIGLSEDALACGAHWPSNLHALRDLAASGQEARQIHNNCSGKHCAMLAVAVHQGLSLEGYTVAEHGVQRDVRQVLEEMCEVDLEKAPCAIDGCSVPNWALPLQALASGFARFGRPEILGRTRAKACTRIMTAVFENPFMVAGSDGYASEVMSILGNRAYVKNGAEGVFSAALPELALGVALKCDDGSPRAAQFVMNQILHRFGVIKEADSAAMAQFLEPNIKNSNALVVGKIIASNSWL